MYSIGLDVSKSTINVYIPKTNLDLVINNDLKSIKSLYSKLKKLYKKEIDKLVFIFEPTGNYSYALKAFCSEKNIRCFIVNPKQSSNFTKAVKERNKTDITDARVLSKMLSVALDEDVKVPVINVVKEELKELIAGYKLIIKQQTTAKNHIAALKVKKQKSFMIKEFESQYQYLKKQELKIIKQIKSIIKQDKNLLDIFLNLQTIDGVGEISSIVLLSHFIQYPDANQRQIVSLAGLDPIEKSSGSSVRGKSRISKSGSKICRGALFMPVMVATQRNEKLKRFYNRLKDNGKHTTVAQIAVMRKLLIIAHSLYKKNEVYDPSRI